MRFPLFDQRLNDRHDSSGRFRRLYLIPTLVSSVVKLLLLEPIRFEPSKSLKEGLSFPSPTTLDPIQRSRNLRHLRIQF